MIQELEADSGVLGVAPPHTVCHIQEKTIVAKKSLYWVNCNLHFIIEDEVRYNYI